MFSSLFSNVVYRNFSYNITGRNHKIFPATHKCSDLLLGYKKRQPLFQHLIVTRNTVNFSLLQINLIKFKSIIICYISRLWRESSLIFRLLVPTIRFNLLLLLPYIKLILSIIAIHITGVRFFSVYSALYNPGCYPTMKWVPGTPSPAISCRNIIDNSPLPVSRLQMHEAKYVFSLTSSWHGA
jgi:hypothetical protein